jgi:hypothetical protein
MGLAMLIAPQFVWGQFTTGPSYAVDEGPRDAILADFNGDGKLDIAVSTLSNDIDILLGNGDGTFKPAVSYPTIGMRPWQVVAGDFRNNGILDLVAATGYGSTVSLLLGNGDGTFQPATLIKTGLHPMCVAVADVNLDGKLDLIVANHSAGTLSIYLGNGDGTFQSPMTFSLGPVSSAADFLLPRWIAVADFNNDGIPDVAVSNANSAVQFPSTVSVLLGNGNGTFQQAVFWDVGAQPLGIAAADVNDDGNMDIITADNTSGTASVLLGNGDGTFKPRVAYPVGSKPQGVVVGDFYGDGILDLVVSNEYSDNVTLLLGNGDGTFQKGINYAAGNFPENLTAGDIRGIGKLDLVVPDFNTNNVQVLFNSFTQGSSRLEPR